MSKVPHQRVAIVLGEAFVIWVLVGRPTRQEDGAGDEALRRGRGGARARGAARGRGPLQSGNADLELADVVLKSPAHVGGFLGQPCRRHDALLGLAVLLFVNPHRTQVLPLVILIYVAAHQENQ